jgi:hypothetical protein
MADPARRLNEASAEAERSLEEQLAPVVGSPSFAALLAEAMGTTMAMIRLTNDAFELGLRTMRLATQGELTRLGVQMGRLEDKLEDVLVAVEQLEETEERRRPGHARPARRSP